MPGNLDLVILTLKTLIRTICLKAAVCLISAECSEVNANDSFENICKSYDLGEVEVPVLKI